MKNKFLLLTFLLAAFAGGSPAVSAADSTNPIEGYKDTPMLPGGKWHVHDPDRPQPLVVTPGTFSTQANPGQPPSDAIVLFNGGDLSQWRDSSGKPAQWKVENGEMTVGKGYLYTKQEFGDIQLHVEFAEPTPPVGNGQGRGNSGVFLMGKFELQVVDSYQSPTYPDGQMAALYGQHPPLVNACLPPGQWQVYDIIFNAPRFGKDNQLLSPAYITVFHNGVVVQNHQAYLGPTRHRSRLPYTPLSVGPVALQDHQCPVRYRNIWVRPLQTPDDP